MKEKKLPRFLKQYGFRIAFLLFVFLLALFKDLHFQLNLKAPTLRREEAPVPAVRQPDGLPPPDAPSGRDPMIAQEKPADSPPAIIERFDLNPLAGSAPTLPSAPPDREEGPARAASLDAAELDAFVRRFAHVAVSERKRFGVPASLTLAHGLLLSHAGGRDLTRRSNNYFGLRCTPDWNGQRLTRRGTCFRAYENAWTSFRDHSLYLKQGGWTQLAELENDDYRGWARGLEQAGFYPPGVTAREVIQLIEGKKLYRHDRR